MRLVSLSLIAAALYAQSGSVSINSGTDGPVNVKKPIGTSAFPPNFTTAGATAGDKSLVITESATNGLPAIIQKTSGTGSGSQASLATSNFGASVTAGNALIVLVGVGNNGLVKVTDTLSNGWTQQGCVANSTTFETCIFYSTNIIGGTDAVTVTPSASVSLCIAAYEVSGIMGPGGGGVVNATGSGLNQQGTIDGGLTATTGTSTSPSVTQTTGTSMINEIAFGAIAIGTADQTPTAFTPWANDFNLTVGGTPSGLFGLHTYSMPLGFPNTLSLSGTITSEPWAIAFSVFRTVAKASVTYISNTPQVEQGSNLGPSNAWFVKGTFGANNNANAIDRITTLPAVYQTTYQNGVNGTSQNDAAIPVGTDGLVWTANLPAMRPASYTASKNTAGSSTTDQSCIPGNATNTVLVYSLKISALQTTAGNANIQVIKRSAADTGGTSANMTSVPDDSNYTGASTTPVTYTGTGPSVGAAVGDLDDQILAILASGTTATDGVYVADWKMKPIVLRGTAQVICWTTAATLSSASTVWRWLEISTITP